jgi:hypothetical protein
LRELACPLSAPVDVGDAAPPKTEIARGKLPLEGKTHGSLKFTLPKDLPVGTYRLDVLADEKPWASLEFPVVAPKEAPSLAKPADLLPLEPGTKWTYSQVLEAGPTVKKLTVSGAEQGADGKTNYCGGQAEHPEAPDQRHRYQSPKDRPRPLGSNCMSA